MLASVFDPPHWAAGALSEQENQHLFWIEHALYTESSADVRGDNSDTALRNFQYTR
jgi:hypothetical protein